MTRRRSTLRERLLGATEGVAKVYRFTFMHSGWAHFTVNDATGELNIQSDWGDYSYRWNISALGQGIERVNGNPIVVDRRATLTEFLPTCDEGYLTGKLTGGLPLDERQDLDVVATRRGMVKWVAERYRDGALDSLDRPGHAINRDELTNLYKEVAAFVDNAAYDLHGAYDFPGDYVAHYFEDLYEWFVYRDTARIRFLKAELLPLFLGYLRGEVKVTA